MLSIRPVRLLVLFLLVAMALFCPCCRAQAALLMEEPYGFFGAVNPTGHNAIYFERICAESPVRLRRCEPGELGAVIARYQGIDGYDWVAIPLLPYLYAVENPADVPDHVDRATVMRLRNRYRETHLQILGDHLVPGNFLHGGWTQLAGAAYERRIYAFRFATTPEQDDALIRELNAAPNRTRFNLLYRNCADFSREILNLYFPRSFRRSIFPDAGATTPKQITWKLERYARKHPQTRLTVFEIPQIPGYRRHSGSVKGIDEAFVTSAWAVPIVIANPYLAGGLFVDYLVRGRYHLVPRHPQVLGPDNLAELTMPRAPNQNAESASISAQSAPQTATPSVQDLPSASPDTPSSEQDDGDALPSPRPSGGANE